MPVPRSFLFVALASSLSLAAAQAAPWAQCGGIGYAGPTTCVPQYSCTFLNEYYSQCLPGNIPAGPSTTSRATTSTTLWADPVPTLP